MNLDTFKFFLIAHKISRSSERSRGSTSGHSFQHRFLSTPLIPIDYIKTAFERLGVSDNFRLLLGLYGFTVLEDFETLNSALLEDLERLVTTNSLTAADFSSKSDQRKYLGHELKLSLEERPYRIAPLIRGKLLEKLPPMIKTLAKEKLDFEVFKSNIFKSSTHSNLNISQTHSQCSNTDTDFSLTQGSSTGGYLSGSSTQPEAFDLNDNFNSNNGSTSSASQRSKFDHDYAETLFKSTRKFETTQEEDNMLPSGSSSSSVLSLSSR